MVSSSSRFDRSLPAKSAESGLSIFFDVKSLSFSSSFNCLSIFVKDFRVFLTLFVVGRGGGGGDGDELTNSFLKYPNYNQ